ncbi:hypothetical protein VUJ46_00955 [Chryseobacterium sp. MYb264]|nr:hypothetical protein VUJ46_00955 [Chryseobacterium sp. MYb264]
MKTIIYIGLLIFLILTGCYNKKNDEIKKNKNMKSTSKEYYLNHKFGNLNYEIYVNDILVGNSNKGNGVPGPYEINPYIFSSGSQKIRIQLSAPAELEKKHLSDKDIENLKGKTFISLLENENFDNISIIKEINFSILNDTRSYVEQEWNFDAQAVDGINNLDNSQDLTKIDKEKFQKEVLAKYEQLRTLLNSGNGKAFINEMEKPIKVIFKTEYMPENEQAEYKNNLEKHFDSHKGTMNPITNFNIKIMGNGRAVALEYKTGKMQGLGILSSEDIPNHTMNINYIILHKPIGSDKFEIFRYNCSFTQLEK